MKQLFALFIGLHGLSHLLGLLPEFEPFAFPYLGLFWGLAFLLFAGTVRAYLLERGNWWYMGLFAVFLSQILVFAHWEVAWAGTIPNVIILFACLVASQDNRFRRTTDRELQQLMGQLSTQVPRKVTEAKMMDLPAPVRQWLTRSGVVGKPYIQSLYMEQLLSLKLRPGQAQWKTGLAKQYVTTSPPGFLWTIETRTGPGLLVSGRDFLNQGHGAMWIRLISLFNLVKVKSQEKIDEAALQRFLAEIAWYPSAALSPRITWESVDDRSARATLNQNGKTVSGVFHFLPDGRVEAFSTNRFRSTGKNAKRERWTVDMQEHNRLNEVEIPTKAQVNWQLPNGNWTWLRIEVEEWIPNFHLQEDQSVEEIGTNDNQVLFHD